MSLKVAELYGELDLKSDKFDREMGGVRGKLSKLGPMIAGAAVAGGVALAAGMYKGITAASDLNESVSKTKVVFGAAAQDVLSWSKTSAQAFGMSRQAALESAGTLGNLMTSMGLAQGPAKGMSTRMVELAGDLASFNNVAPEEALEALRSGLVGETEPLKRFGVNMNEATLKAQALKMGLVENANDVLPANVKALAAYELIMQQTKTAQGDFGRTSGGFANQMRILKAEITNLFANVGQYLLPLATSVVKGLRVIVSGIGPVIDGIRGFFSGGGAGGLGSGMFKPLIDAAKSLGPVFEGIKSDLGKLWAIVGPVLGRIADYMGPVLAKAIAYVAPVLREFGQTVAKQVHYVVVLAQFIKQHWGTIVQFVGPVFKIISTIISTAFKVIVDIVRAALAIMRGDWDGAKAALIRIATTIKNGIITVLKALGQLAVAILRAAWAAVKAATSAAWSGIKSAVSSGASAVVSYVRGLPGRILGALGNLGSLLYSAGRSIISGLLNGIRDALSAVWDEVSSIAGKIKDLKGPLDYDRVLLRPAGQAIIGGLMTGIADQLGPLYAQVGAIGPRLAVSAAPRLSLAGVPAAGGSPGRAIVIDARGSLFAQDAATVISDLADYGYEVKLRRDVVTRGLTV